MHAHTGIRAGRVGKEQETWRVRSSLRTTIKRDSKLYKWETRARVSRWWVDNFLFHTELHRRVCSERVTITPANSFAVVIKTPSDCLVCLKCINYARAEKKSTRTVPSHKCGPILLFKYNSARHRARSRGVFCFRFYLHFFFSLFNRWWRWYSLPRGFWVSRTFDWDVSGTEERKVVIRYVEAFFLRNVDANFRSRPEDLYGRFRELEIFPTKDQFLSSSLV